LQLAYNDYCKGRYTNSAPAVSVKRPRWFGP